MKAYAGVKVKRKKNELTYFNCVEYFMVVG